MTLTQNVVDTYKVIDTIYGYAVLKNGFPLLDRVGLTRWFRSRNSARKRISRERSGNFHK